VLEICSDVPSQRWDAELLIFNLVAGAVADVVEEEIAQEPGHDARLTGCDRAGDEVEDQQLRIPALAGNVGADLEHAPAALVEDRLRRGDHR
jgi:hypothetical protein